MHAKKDLSDTITILRDRKYACATVVSTFAAGVESWWQFSTVLPPAGKVERQPDTLSIVALLFTIQKKATVQTIPLQTGQQDPSGVPIQPHRWSNGQRIGSQNDNPSRHSHIVQSSIDQRSPLFRVVPLYRQTALVPANNMATTARTVNVQRLSESCPPFKRRVSSSW